MDGWMHGWQNTNLDDADEEGDQNWEMYKGNAQGYATQEHDDGDSMMMIIGLVILGLRKWFHF